MSPENLQSEVLRWHPNRMPRTPQMASFPCKGPATLLSLWMSELFSQSLRLSPANYMGKLILVTIIWDLQNKRWQVRVGQQKDQKPCLLLQVPFPYKGHAFLLNQSTCPSCTREEGPGSSYRTAAHPNWEESIHCFAAENRGLRLHSADSRSSDFKLSRKAPQCILKVTDRWSHRKSGHSKSRDEILKFLNLNFSSSHILRSCPWISQTGLEERGNIGWVQYPLTVCLTLGWKYGHSSYCVI